MSRFIYSTIFFLKHEGGFSDDPADKGGATDYGISLRFLQSLPDTDGDGWLDGDLDHDGDVDVDDIHFLDKVTALEIYEKQFWDRYRYSEIQDQSIATKIMDLCINMGAGAAHRIVQNAVCVHKIIKVDGILGSGSLAAINSIDGKWLISEICHYAAQYYYSLSQPKFIKGWLNRAYDLP
jgi:lysozyme family protein